MEKNGEDKRKEEKRENITYSTDEEEEDDEEYQDIEERRKVEKERRSGHLETPDEEIYGRGKRKKTSNSLFILTNEV